jgi:hypothetical protein
MNSISGILAREYIKTTDRINILWTSCDSIIFDQIIKKLNHNLLGFDHLYFAKDVPNIIICNNKLLYHEKCKNISIQFHIPVLVIDHSEKPKDLLDDDSIGNKYELPTAYKIAMNENIAKSWGGSYNKVLDNKNATDIEFWQSTIFRVTKMVFKYYA